MGSMEHHSYSSTVRIRHGKGRTSLRSDPRKSVGLLPQTLGGNPKNFSTDPVQYRKKQYDISLHDVQMVRNMTQKFWEHLNPRVPWTPFSPIKLLRVDGNPALILGQTHVLVPGTNP